MAIIIRGVFMRLRIIRVLLTGAISSFSLLYGAELYPQNDYLTADWSGTRSALHDSGLQMGLSYTTEPAVLLSGGYDEGSSTYLHNINFEFKADLQNLIGWDNTTFLAKISSRHGDNLSELYVAPGGTPDGRYIYGEYFNKSQEVYGGQRTKLVNLQLTYRPNENLSVDIGRLVMNDHFLRSDIYCDFMNNSTCGSPKGVFTPYALDAYPDATMGLHGNWKVNEEIQIQLGLFDGGWTKQNSNGLDWELGLNGTAIAGEIDYFLQRGSVYGEQKVIKAGINHHSGDFNNFKTGEQTSGNSAYYLLADLGVYSEGEASDQGLSLFLSYVYNPDEELAGLTHFYNLGFVYKGIIPKRDSDKLGVSFVYAKHSKYNTYTDDFLPGNVRGDEKIVEVSYNYYLPYGIQIMPDIQYIINPNGALNFDNALIAGMKLNLNF